MKISSAKDINIEDNVFNGDLILYGEYGKTLLSLDGNKFKGAFVADGVEFYSSRGNDWNKDKIYIKNCNGMPVWMANIKKDIKEFRGY